MDTNRSAPPPSLTLSHGDTVTIAGNTYQLREQLRGVGLLYNVTAKTWSGAIKVETYTKSWRYLARLNEMLAAGTIRIVAPAPASPESEWLDEKTGHLKEDC